ncbi:HamA C-terminal domain-containing protein [Anaeromyxobacter paludicola]|nr:DUF1837 domain-containing protein [Anaeromyxobacter paludicola]
MAELAEQLRAAIHGKYDGLGVRFRQVAYEWKEPHINVAGTFFYPALAADGAWALEELATFLYYHAIPFCVPRSERERLEQQYDATRDHRYLAELVDQARNLFVKAKKSRKSTGEPGELILFVFLEGVVGAPQIACKMYLKTSTSMHLHGADSIHATVGSRAATLRILWGESKLKKNLNGALSSVCDSLAKFVKEEQGQTQRGREIDIIRAHLNVTDEALRKALLQYFDPYDECSNQREETYACLVSYDHKRLFDGLAKVPADKRDAVLVARYKEAAAEACKAFAAKLSAAKLDHLSVHLFLLPVPSVLALRKAFLRQLGVIR